MININNYRRTVIDSWIAFQIENFVKSDKDKKRINWGGVYASTC